MTDVNENRGRPPGSWQSDPKEYPTRFHKFYYKNRAALLESNRLRYADRKKNGLCVVCGENKIIHSSKLFCERHLRKSKKKNKVME
jgi:hypothetical protein